MARGRDGYVRAKIESSYAGAFPASGMTTIGFTAENNFPDREYGEATNITGLPTVTEHFETKQFTRLGLSGVANYNQLNHLLYSMLWAIDETTPIAAEAGTSSKIFKPGTTKRSLALEVSKGNVPASKVFQFKGGVGSKLRFDFPNNGGVNYSWEGMGTVESSTATTGSDPATGALSPTTDIVKGSHMGVRDIGTGADGAYCIRSGFIELNQGVSNDDVCLGSAAVGEIEVADFLRITGEFVIKFVDRGVYDDFLLGTALTGDIMFTSPNEIVAGGTATKRSLRFKLNRFKYRAPGGLVLVDQPGGPLTARVPWVAEGVSGSGVSMEPMTVTVADEYTVAVL